MHELTYIAELSAADCQRFRELDPALPETYAAWTQATSEQVRTLRARGVQVVVRPIAFEDFKRTMEILHTGSFDAGARNRYAADMAAADRNSGRF